MRIDYDLKKDLEDIKLDTIIMQKELDFNKRKYDEICDLLNKSAIFDDKVIFIISDLMSYYEGVTYAPFIYSKTNVFFKGYMEVLYVGIAPEDNIISFMNNETNITNDNIDKFFQQKRGYEIFQFGSNANRINKEDRIISLYDFREDDDNKKLVAFPFLLNNYNVDYTYPFTTSLYNFEDYEYVRDFMSYLFELQVKNSGKMLTYKDMTKAMDDYLELDEGFTRKLEK